VVRVLIDLAKSPHVVLSRDDAIRLLEGFMSITRTRDLEEATRILRSFDEYLRYMRRKFEDYINLPKDPGDALRGRVVVHKMKLYMDDGREMVEIVFDRRIRVEDLVSILKNMGFTDVTIEEQAI